MRRIQGSLETVSAVIMADMRSVALGTSRLPANGPSDATGALNLQQLSNEETRPCNDGSCKLCKEDNAFLRRKSRPSLAKSTGMVRVVDLFAGGGGMSAGLQESARCLGLGLKIALAVEFDKEVAAVYESNQADAKVRNVDVASLFDGILGSPATATEIEVAKQVGSCQILLGGPPCQGNSDLNNHTRREDPKNALYLLMARAAEILKPDIVVIENVGPVQWDKGDVVNQTKKALEGRDYAVAGRVIDLRRVGVPQRRHRYLLIASKLASVVPDAVLDTLATMLDDHPDRDVRWAIGDLEDFSSETTFDSSSKATKTNIKRIDYLFKKGKWDLPNPQRPKCHKDKEHSYVSMYGRLRWDEPAQTITTGFGSMGQGRYVHPSQRRTITPHEAARLQTFPDTFDFGKNTRRGVLAKVIGNAVPPLLMLRVGDLILPAIKATMTGSGPDLNGASEPDEKLYSTRRSTGPMPSSVAAHNRMLATRQRDTTAEIALRRTLHAAGLRYRVDQAVLSGSKRRADLVFSSERVAVFVDGCFWHGCPIHGTQPKANGSWWLDKLESNHRRDRDTDRRLTEAGWHVIRVWEHEAAAEAAARIESTLNSRRTRPER